MKYRHLASTILLTGLVLRGLQGQTINATVADASTGEGIPFVFVFLANSSVGATTDEKGAFRLDLDLQGEQGALVFSHLNYELQTIILDDAALKKDTFFLALNPVELEQVQVAEKYKPRFRTKWLKKFSEAFLGATPEKKLIKIVNPEILLFREEDKKLTAMANEPLVITNKLLGYKIDFYLETFELDLVTDDLLYKGSAYFKEIEGGRKELAKFKRNRKKTYQKTSRRFFADLVKRRASEEDYAVGFSALNPNREFIAYQPAAFDSIRVNKLPEDRYVIKVKGYFTVAYKKEIVNRKPPKSNFGPKVALKNKPANEEENSPATSYYRSRTDEILVNRRGIVLNPLEVEEFGYWADQRIGLMLPFDYQ